MPLNWIRFLDSESWNESTKNWPLVLLKNICEKIYSKEIGVFSGIAIPNGNPTLSYHADIPYNSHLIHTPVKHRKHFSELKLGKNNVVNFYSITPLYPEEFDLYEKYGMDTILNLFETFNINDIMDLKRSNVAINFEENRYVFPAERLNWGAPQIVPGLITLSKYLEQKFQEAILLALKDLAIKEPIFCIMLYYDNEGNDVFPPRMNIYLESEKAPLSEMFFSKIAYSCIFLHKYLTDEKTQRYIKLANNTFHQEFKYESGFKTVEKIALKLNSMNLSGIIEKSSDFFAFAIGVDEALVNKKIKKFTGEQLFEILKKQNLI